MTTERKTQNQTPGCPREQHAADEGTEGGRPEEDGIERELLLSTPALMPLGDGFVRLSGTARRMRSINLLPLGRRREVVRKTHFRATDALSGSDELAGEAARLLHSVAFRPLEIPEHQAPLFAAFDALHALQVGKDGKDEDRPLPLAGTTLAVSGNIDVEGVAARVSGDLIDEPAARTARPVRSLLEAGASLAVVTHAGEFLGGLLPEARARSMTAGEPVQPLEGLLPPALKGRPDPRGDTPFKALAATVAAGAASTGVALGRGSDLAAAALRAGLVSYTPSEGAFSSRDGFVSNWRFGRWGFLSHTVTDAHFMTLFATGDEAVSTRDAGHAPWEMPGFRPMLHAPKEHVAWRHALCRANNLLPERIAVCFDREWQDGEMRDFARELLDAVCGQNPFVRRIRDFGNVAAEAPEIDWITAAELVPTLNHYLSRRHPLHPDMNTNQLAMMLTLAERVKRGPWKRSRLVNLLRRAPELLSPWTPRVLRKGLADLARPFDLMLEECDAVICFGGSPALDALRGPQVAVPLGLNAGNRGVGAVVTAAPGRDDLAALVASMLEDARRARPRGPELTWRPPTCCLRADDDLTLRRLTPEEIERAAAERGAAEADGNGRRPEAGEAAEGDDGMTDFALSNFHELAELSMSTEDTDSIRIRTESDPAGGRNEAAGERPAGERAEDSPKVDPALLEARVKALVEDFREALSSLGEEDEEEGGTAEGSGDGADGTDAGPKPASRRAAIEREFAALPPEDRAWLSTWFGGLEKKCLFLVHEPFARAVLPDHPAKTRNFTGRWSQSDKDYLVTMAQYWLYRRGSDCVRRIYDRAPAACRTFAMRENLILALLLEPDPAPAVAELRTLEPRSDRERSAKEWLLGLAAQRTGDQDDSIEHFRRSRDLAPENSAAYFPLAQALLNRFGPDNEEYLAAREALSLRAPSGRQLLLAEEAKQRREANFESNLLPDLTPGIFEATVLLGPNCLELRKERLSDELWNTWGLAVTDRTPGDPDVFTVRVGTLEGALRFVSGRFEDATLAEALQRSPNVRGAETILLANEGRIEIRLCAGTTPAREAAVLFAQLEAALLRVSEPIGVMMHGLLLPAEQLLEHVSVIREGHFPLLAVLSIGMTTVLGERFISSYGLRSLGLPEIEIDVTDAVPAMAGMLALNVADRMVSGEFNDEAVMLRFGPDPEHLTQLSIRRAPGRRVAGEVLRLSPGDGTEEETLPQA